MFDMTATRDRILFHSLELFAQRGYNSVSIRQVANEVGITGPSLYNHFGSKEEILQTLVQLFVAYSGKYEPTREEMRRLCSTGTAKEAIMRHAYDYTPEDSGPLLLFTRLAHQEQYSNPILRGWIVDHIEQKSKNMAEMLDLLAELGKVTLPQYDSYMISKIFVRALFMIAMEVTLVQSEAETVRLSKDKQEMFRCFVDLVAADGKGGQ